MTQLPPAYRGAPYYQPGPPPPKQRAARVLRMLAIAALVLLLLILIGAAIAPAAFPSSRSRGQICQLRQPLVPAGRCVTRSAGAMDSGIHRVRGVSRRDGFGNSAGKQG